MHEIITNILRFIINRKRLLKWFEQYKWFNDLVYYEAQRIIGNR